MPPSPCPPTIILPFIVSSRFSPSPPFLFDLRSGSLYTRSALVLNVLSLLMPRSACPRGRSTVHFCLPSSFSCPDIELYTRAVFIVQNPCEGRERKRRTLSVMSTVIVFMRLPSLHPSFNLLSFRTYISYRSFYIDLINKFEVNIFIHRISKEGFLEIANDLLFQEEKLAGQYIWRNEIERVRGGVVTQ